MVTLSQTWKEIGRSIISKKTFKVFFVISAFLFLFFGIRACSSYFNPNIPVYRIARDPTWHPLQLYNKENNITAFSGELLAEIAEEQNLKVELFSSGSQNLFEGLDYQTVDAVLSSLNPDLVAKGSYFFSEPYYSFGAVIVVPANSKIAALEDLSNKVVAVKRGSSVLFNLPLASSAIITPYDSPTFVLNELILNRIDAVIMDQFTAYLFLSEFFRNRLKVASLPITIEGLRLITKKDAKGAFLIKKFNEGLKALKENGTYDLLLNKWDLSFQGALDSKMD
ncbi:putative bacterial extracellular solute-binding protein [Chlamydiales bacterium STE3]|nr:putative bacterial extracellular solute-binding protein [Chlamydiales bacterium STE3]